MSANGTATIEAPEAQAPAEQTLPFPLHTFDEAAPYLRRPFTPQAVKFKPQRKVGNETLCVAYLDARLVIERLNLVVGSRWTAGYEPVAGGLMWCHLTVCGVTRSDVGEGKGKALISDALKRAAVHFGVGVPTYAVPASYLPGEVRSIDGTKAARLRTEYEKWLTETGIPHFGEPLDHGDAEDGSQGDPDEAAATLDEQPEAIDDAIADEKVSPKHAKQLVDAAYAIGVEARLQLAASHVAQVDVGDCSTKAKAAVALTNLTVEQADRVRAWVQKKGLELAAAEASA